MSEIRLNESGQCPFCKKKPLVYKRKLHYFCARWDGNYDLITGRFKENWAWSEDNKCKHPGRPIKSSCPACGKWDND